MKKKQSIRTDGATAPKSIGDRILKFSSLITIEPSLLVHMTASFMGNLLLKNLLLYKACHVNLGYNASLCEDLVDKAIKNKTLSAQLEDEAQEITASIGVWTSVIDNAFPVLFVLFLGAWSDVYGRKFPYLLSILGYVVRYALLILSAHYNSWNAEVTAIVSALPVALTGSRTAISMVIYSYVTDTTSIKERTLRVGVATAVRTFGKSLGSAVGGQMSKSGMGYYVIFGVSGGLDLLGLLYAMLFLKNIRDPNVVRSKSTCVQMKHIFNFRNITDTVVAFFRKREKGDRARLFLLVIALMCTMAPMQAEETKLYEYTRKQDGLGWDAGKYGYYNTFRMIVAFIGGITSVGLLSRGLKMSDAVIGIVSCVSQIASSFMYAYAHSDLMMYMAPLIDILNGTMIIASRSMISKIIPRHETGKVNSFVATIDSITPLIASPLYNKLYQDTLDTFLGAFFLLSAAITVPPLIIFMILGCFWKRDDFAAQKVEIADQSSETGSQDSGEIQRRASYNASGDPA